MYQTTASKKVAKRVKGDQWMYFFIHNGFSIFFFFVFAYYFRLYEKQNDSLGWIFKREFWDLFGIVFGVSVVFGLFSRFMSYYLIRASVDVQNNMKSAKYVKTIKTFGEMNTGINELGMKWILATLATALVFVFGFQIIVQAAIFKDVNLWTFIGSYGIIKIAISLMVTYFVQTKL